MRKCEACQRSNVKVTLRRRIMWYLCDTCWKHCKSELA